MLNTSNQLTVFLVDDDDSVRKSLLRALSMRGFTIETFDSAAAFLAAFTPNCRGCLLLDLSMPEMNGLELQQTLQQRGATLPIIFITGHGGVPESVQALKAGAIDFLEKPFKQETLLERIEEAFAQDLTNARQARIQEDRLFRFSRLTDREKDVLRLLVKGSANLSSKEIARELGISFRTVAHHRARIFEKTQAKSIADLARMADSAGFTHLDAPD